MTRRFLSRAHRWLGVCLGGPFALIGLTGSLLIFYVEIDRAVHPALHAPVLSGGTSSPNWDQAVSTLRRTYPDKQGPWRLEVTPDQRFIPARYYDPPERAGQAFAPMLVWLSADGTHVLRQDYWGDTAMTWLYDLHYRLMLGEAGAILIGLEGLALIFALLIGMVLWWPRGSWAKALRYKSQAAPSRRLRDQHKLLGLASIVPLVLLAFGGQRQDRREAQELAGHQQQALTLGQGSGLHHRQVHEQPRQIEHPRHPGDHRNHMKRLGPDIPLGQKIAHHLAPHTSLISSSKRKKILS